MFRRTFVATVIAATVGMSGVAEAHPVPFTYLDLRLQSGGLEISLVAHIIDVAHDLNIVPPEQLLDEAVLRSRSAEVVRLLSSRLQLAADGRPVDNAVWSSVEPLPERQSVRIQGRSPLVGVTGVLALDAKLFPYDPMHQTFVNFYEGDALKSQTILDASKSRTEYFAGTRQGVQAVIRRFAGTGFTHVVVGPDHLLFLLGLLLLGGSIRWLAVLVTAFTAAQALTLSLSAFHVLTPPSRLIEPAISLSIVYVGIDNLMVRGGRDVRAWIASTFGFFHGFGFAPVLRAMDLPRRALGWSIFSFNVGIEAGQLLVMIAVAAALSAIRTRSEVADRRLAVAGSIAVIAAGAFWFIQRVFFSRGLV
jgi:hydrogenase/urease accessory protein HupE